MRCLFSRELEAFSQQDDEVTLHLKTEEGQRETVKAQWLVACDGGASFVRRTLNVPFEGKTAPNQWIVVDIANDPLSTPHIYLCCDPVRPYVSAALPHAVRRFEFMVMPGETEEQLREPQNMRKLLSKVLPNPDNVELIRQRVYTHNARLAQRFRIDRVLLAGDAAHIMPVWQGQGYNSGMRDAFNLAWKLALVIQGKARDALLDTYQQERRDHAKAMIDLSVTAGNVLAPPKRWQGTLRDGVSWLLNYLPPVKRYFLEMRFKPMPQYYGGALVREGEAKHSPVGKMFIQPKVTLENGDVTLLDNAIGANFAVIGWGCNPLWGMSDEQIQQWRALGTRFIQVVPEVQIHTAQDNRHISRRPVPPESCGCLPRVPGRTVPPRRMEALAAAKGLCLEQAADMDYRAYREQQYDKLAESLREHLDMDAVYRIMGISPKEKGEEKPDDGYTVGTGIAGRY